MRPKTTANGFPFDKPTEIHSKYHTASSWKIYDFVNGKLIESKNLGNGRADRWVQDKPHTVLGNDSGRRLGSESGNLEWHTTPIHRWSWIRAADAKAHLQSYAWNAYFLFKTINYPYPWDKYAQIVVKEYVSEQWKIQRAVVFGDFIQKTWKWIDAITTMTTSFHAWNDAPLICWPCHLRRLVKPNTEWRLCQLCWIFVGRIQNMADKTDHHRMEELNGYLSQVYSGGAHRFDWLSLCQ